MPLETGTYLPDLNASNPAHTDGVNQADSHLRLIKSVLLATFPNFTDVALSSTQAALDAAATFVSGVIKAAVDGTISAPAFTFASEVALGLYRKSAGVLGIAAGSADVVTFSATGATFTNTPLVGANTVAHTGNLPTALQGSYEPIGAIQMYVGSSDPDSYHAICDGRAISRSTYATLFALISTTYGSGNGTTTFNIPNFSERVPVGKSPSQTLITQYNATALGNTFGEGLHTLSSTEMPSHAHTLTDPGHLHSLPSNGVNNPAPGGSFPYLSTGTGLNTGSATTGITMANTGGGGSHNNVQPSLVTNFIIRVL